MKKLLIMFLLLTAAFLSAETPEELSKRYYDYLKNGQWQKIAELYEDAALEEYRDGMMEMTSNDRMISLFFGQGVTTEEVKTWDNHQFFSNILKNSIGGALEQGEVTYGKIDIIGSIQENDIMTHVLVRVRTFTNVYSTEELRTMSFRKNGDEWNLLMDSQIKSMMKKTKQYLDMK